jgi:hypothetical protein
VCSIIGFYRVSRVELNPENITTWDRHRNAHPRRSAPPVGDVVVFADPLRSGRLRCHIPIGDGRSDGHQRVFPDRLAWWGGICKQNGKPMKNGFIQHSGNPPLFKDPHRFLDWFHRREPQLVHANNVE